MGNSQAGVELLIMSSYDNYLKFDQCECPSLKACHLPNRTRPKYDIGEYIDFGTLGISLQNFILVFLLLIITYVVLEIFVGKQISMQRFILGPGIEKKYPKIDNEG